MLTLKATTGAVHSSGGECCCASSCTCDGADQSDDDPGEGQAASAKAVRRMDDADDLPTTRIAALRVLRDAGLPVPAFAEAACPTLFTDLRFPVAVRDACAGIGDAAAPRAVCADAAALAATLAAIGGLQQAIVEETLAAPRAIAVAVLGNRTQAPGGLFDARGYHVFAPLEETGRAALAPEQACRIADIAIAAVEALGVADFARVDMQADAACRVVRVVAVRVLPHFDPQPFLEHSTPKVSLAEFGAALVQLAIARALAGGKTAAAAASTSRRSLSPELLLTEPTTPTASAAPPVVASVPQLSVVKPLAAPFASHFAAASEEDDVEAILSSSSSCSSPPLSPSPAPHGPSHDYAQRYRHSPAQSLRKADVPPEKWNDWRWQLANRMTTAEQLRAVLPLTEEEEAAFNGAAPLFPVAVTPYYASLINPSDPHDPVRLQVLPRAVEAHRGAEDIEDSLGEDSHSPVPGIVHRYPDRVLMLVSMNCGCFCRFCTRNRIVGQRLQTGPLSTYYERQLSYIRATPQVRDVLLSGGDPLMLPLRTLDWILTELHKIPHVEVVRIGSRVPMFVPQRITPELCAMLARHHPLWLNTHVNHPNELTPESCAALARLSNAGIPLGCQTVLLAGVNDCPNIMLELVHKLVKNRVRPYYLYQCDLVVGASHFRTPTSKLYEIIESLRGHTSGFCVPTAVIDAPHGGGKVPVMPSYVLSMHETKTIVRNFEGFVSTYTGPATYHSHDPAACKYCRAAKQGRQDGIAGLLAGAANTIKPEGWDTAHDRRGFSSSSQHF